MNKHHYVAIMAGGIGSRFWPKSRTSYPKQFLDILNTSKTLIQWTFERYAAFIPKENIFIVTSEEYSGIVAEQLPGIPKENIEAKDDVVKVLKVVNALEGRFVTEYVVNIVMGKLTPQIAMFRHENLAEFGIGKDKESHLWNSLIRQMLLENFIKKDIEEYGLLKITEKGEKFLKKPSSFKIVLNNLFEDANEDDEDGENASQTGAASDDKLFEILKDLRHREAKKKSLPPFVIFLENSEFLE